MAGDAVREAWRERFGRPEPKVIGIGLNYRDHAAEQSLDLPAEPLLLAKYASAFCAPGESIVLPARSKHVDAEAELAVVIGRTTRGVGEDDALDAVAGYTCANDVTARDLQRDDGQWVRAKGYDTFCPLLPEVVPTRELGEASGLRIVQRLNGEPFQDSSTGELIFGVRRLVAHVSSVLTLEPGDLILTGTPAGIGAARTPPVPLRPGDEVEIEIEGIGTLRNPVSAESG
jgi:2-keto-4-pentenoate hydratase/2-oxohepta-3-ene-1,7-dioic acid hydratase in catechol pathway